jgi:heme exporter protein C
MLGSIKPLPFWLKITTVLLVLYAIIGGMLFDVPALPILNETIRNLYYHVTMWFGMMILMIISLVASIKYLSSSNPIHDLYAKQAGISGMLLGLLGLFTGMLWAKYTWGAWWVNDPKLNGAAITLLAYSAYFVLRGSIDDEIKRARISAVYNIFAFVLMLVFIMVLPRLTDSLHPGNGGNPAFSTYDLDNRMRMVFYPAVIGWTLLGVWIMNISIRIDILNEKQNTL